MVRLTTMQEEFRKLRENFDIIKQDYGNDELFRGILISMTSLGLVEEGGLAENCTVSRLTARRWMKGRAVPYVAVRPYIIDYLEKRLERWVDAFAKHQK